jgi:hypothetical protein
MNEGKKKGHQRYTNQIWSTCALIMEDETMSNNLRQRTIIFDNRKLSPKMHGSPNVMARAELLK